MVTHFPVFPGNQRKRNEARMLSFVGGMEVRLHPVQQEGWTALGKQDSFFQGGVRSIFLFSYLLLPTDVSERDLLRRDALFGALFFGHCLLRVIIKVELIMFPSTCNHLPYGGLMWKDSSPWGIYSRRHPALLKGRAAEWLRVGALLQVDLGLSSGSFLCDLVKRFIFPESQLSHL